MTTNLLPALSRASLRRLVVLALALALAPLLLGLGFVRPASGQASAFGLYALTANGGAVVIDGDVGEGGGLVVVDGGSPYGAVRLDSSPSSLSRAAAVEPGTLFRTVVGVANTEAGEEVVDVPTAAASYPGDRQESDGDTGGSFEDGGGRMGSATAHVEAHAFDAMVRAEGGGSSYPGAMSQEAGALDILAVADPAAGILTTTVVSRSGRTVFAGGAFVMESVVGTVTTSVTPEGRTVEAGTTAQGAEVGGMPVAITEEGVVVLGNVIVPGAPGQDAQAVVNGVLANAGLTVEAIAPREDVDGNSIVGDSGGVRVTVVTEGNAASAGNRLVYTFGKATATSYDEPPRIVTPAQPIPEIVSPQAPTPTAPSGGTGFAPAPSVQAGGTFPVELRSRCGVGNVGSFLAMLPTAMAADGCPVATRETSP